jgi:6-phosphofructokinase 1
MQISPQDLLVQSLGPCRVESPITSLFDHDPNALNYVDDPEHIYVEHTDDQSHSEDGVPRPGFEAAGPRRKIFFDPSKCRAAIVSCGGLCPGINDVIRGLTIELAQRYGVKHVYGFRNGYAGFIADYDLPVIDLDPESVSEIYEKGGTILGSSRGDQEPAAIVDCLERMSINLLFVIGGDGTLRGASAIVDEITQRNLKIAVVGVPKTIDNDIQFIDESFGFQTAYSEATRHIRAAHVEAKGAPMGIGLVKLMGRHSGFIACYASLAMSDANFVIIPEVPFELHGPRGFLGQLKSRMIRRKHAVIVVAEGAGQHLLATPGGKTAKDASGNEKLGDIGIFLRDSITTYFREQTMQANVKYIDPSYSVRSVPASPHDSVYCFQLAMNAVHAAMTGRTAMVVGRWHAHYVHIPMHLAIRQRKTVDPRGPLWMAVLESTNQPVTWK